MDIYINGWSYYLNKQFFLLDFLIYVKDMKSSYFAYMSQLN